MKCPSYTTVRDWTVRYLSAYACTVQPMLAGPRTPIGPTFTAPRTTQPGATDNAFGNGVRRDANASWANATSDRPPPFRRPV